jgi:hypothetical protein
MQNLTYAGRGRKKGETFVISSGNDYKVLTFLKKVRPAPTEGQLPPIKWAKAEPEAEPEPVMMEIEEEAEPDPAPEPEPAPDPEPGVDEEEPEKPKPKRKYKRRDLKADD